MSNYLPAKVTKEHLQNLEKSATDYRELVISNSLSPISTIKQACAMQMLRELLTDDIMQPIMQLQGSKLGFKTDKDLVKQNGKYTKGPGYPVQVVKDVAIWAWGHGAAMTMNEVNIIAGNGYLTKEYFQRRLNEVIGRGKWEFIHEIPRTQQGGAVVKTKVRWIEGGNWKEQELTHGIKGDSYSTTDAYCGKADRKCGAWLLRRATGESLADGEVDGDFIDVEAKEVKGDLLDKKIDWQKLLDGAPVTADEFLAHIKKRGVSEQDAAKNIKGIVGQMLGESK